MTEWKTERLIPAGALTAHMNASSADGWSLTQLFLIFKEDEFFYNCIWHKESQDALREGIALLKEDLFVTRLLLQECFDVMDLMLKVRAAVPVVASQKFYDLHEKIKQLDWIDKNPNKD